MNFSDKKPCMFHIFCLFCFMLKQHSTHIISKLLGSFKEKWKKKKKPLCNQFKNSREEPSRKSNMKWLMVESYRLLNLVP